MAIKGLNLNSAPASLFTGNSADTRNDVIAGGRMLMADAYKREANRVRNNSSETLAHDDATYAKLNEGVSHKTLLYCAKIAANATGSEAPETYADFLRLQKSFMRDPIFLRTLSGIVKEVVSPMIPYTTSNALGALAMVDKTPIGKTYEVKVLSNDVFVFQDSSWGATRSVPKNMLYDANITINPQPKAAAAKIKWYQLVGNSDGGADIGRFYLALSGGIQNKVLGLWNSVMTAAATDAKFVPAYLRFNSYTTANWISAAKAVSKANGIPRTNLVAYGDFAALSKVLPSGTAQDAALTYQLGNEWITRGFLGTVMGVPLAEIQGAYVAGTVNNAAPVDMLSASTIYMVARAGESYAPVTIVFEDDPIVLELDPSRTGDTSIDVNMTVSIGAGAVFGTKTAVLSNIS